MNIVLLILDTARGDTTNSLIEENKLPNLAELADNGQYYTDARANAPWTVPSHGTIFTGKYPSDTGINGIDPTYDGVPLVDELRSRGYTTAGFSANPWLSSSFGFDSSFERFEYKYDYYPSGASMHSVITSSKETPSRIKSFVSDMRCSPILKSFGNIAFWAYQRRYREDSGGKYLLSRAGDWLSKPSSKSKFAFINVTDPHLPYNVPEGWLPDDINPDYLLDINQDVVSHITRAEEMTGKKYEILYRIYESTLKYIDHYIGKLVDKAPKNTIFIVASDHGEHFGEYDRFGHQYSLHRELLHVPLVIMGPTVDRAKIEKTVELRDLYEYILNIAEEKSATLPILDEHIAELVAPRPSVETLRTKSSTDLPSYVHRYGCGVRCISKEGAKLIEFPDGKTEFIRESTTDKSIENAEFRESLQKTLREARGKVDFGKSSDLNVSDPVESRLKDLGYA